MRKAKLLRGVVYGLADSFISNYRDSFPADLPLIELDLIQKVIQPKSLSSPEYAQILKLCREWFEVRINELGFSIQELEQVLIEFQWTSPETCFCKAIVKINGKEYSKQVRLLGYCDPEVS